MNRDRFSNVKLPSVSFDTKVLGVIGKHTLKFSMQAYLFAIGRHEIMAKLPPIARNALLGVIYSFLIINSGLPISRILKAEVERTPIIGAPIGLVNKYLGIPERAIMKFMCGLTVGQFTENGQYLCSTIGISPKNSIEPIVLSSEDKLLGGLSMNLIEGFTNSLLNYVPYNEIWVVNAQEGSRAKSSEPQAAPAGDSTTAPADAGSSNQDGFKVLEVVVQKNDTISSLCAQNSGFLPPFTKEVWKDSRIEACINMTIQENGGSEEITVGNPLTVIIVSQ